MNTKRSTRIRALIDGVVIGGVVALAAGPAAGLVARSQLTPGVHQRNTCTYFVQASAMPAYSGATSCVHEVARDYGKSVRCFRRPDGPGHPGW